MTTKPRVAILGSGAAGAFAYQACLQSGVAKVEVFTAKMGKPSAGAFYFHWLPPNVESKVSPEEILWVSIGTEKGYLQKQWGSQIRYDISSSFPIEPRLEIGYDPTSAWDHMWEGAEIDLVAGSFSDTDVLGFGKYYDLVFHSFPSQESREKQPKAVMIPIEMETGTIELPFDVESDNYIMYNGELNSDWTRLSVLFGHMFFEYPANSPYASGGPNIELRPDMHPDTQPWTKLIWRNIIPIGRFAKWNRKELSHQAFWDTYWCLEAWKQGMTDFRGAIIGEYAE